MEKKLKDFCFDVLGDFVDPSNIMIRQDRHGNWQVIIIRGLVCPKEIIREEWDMQTANTEFENVSLYL